MPRRDGTGPMGAGAATGRGLGFCSGVNAAGYGAGFGFGCRRGFGIIQTSPKTQKEILQEQKSLLENRLRIIDNQLENI